jgi:hypothetical protein
MRILRFRRFIIGTALALSVALVGSSSALAAGADVYGVGGGSVNFGTQTKYATFAFSAHTGPSGDFGSFRWTLEPAYTGDDRLDVHVDVDCLNVFASPPFGAEGWISGTVDRVTPTDNSFGLAPGDPQLLYIADYDRSGVLDDQFNVFFFGGPTCDEGGPSSGVNVDQGNINIKLP